MYYRLLRPLVLVALSGVSHAQLPSALDLPVTQLAAGYVHTCALIATGGVQCWGDNISGQLGDGSTNDRWTPAPVAQLDDDVAAIAAGGSHTCALNMGGGVKCWGGNASGQLGNGGGGDNTLPVQVTGLAEGVVAITAGSYHTCAITAEGGVKCWGSNYYGQLGDGDGQNATVPTDVVGLTGGVTGISAGHNHTCAVTMHGGIKCWGRNTDGQVGNGSIVYAVTTPVDVMGFAAGSVGVAAGEAHTCAATAFGGVLCWGRNMNGQLGDGGAAGSAIPVAVVQLAGASAVVAGGEHSCAWLAAGGAKCWGANFSGALGNGSYEGSSIPVTVSTLGNDVSAMAAGYSHTCSLSVAGGLRCWGNNSNGQLGDDSHDVRSIPGAVAGLASGISAIATSNLHTCALTPAGGAKCWGHNKFGELGSGSIGDNAAPAAVMGFASGAAAVTTGMWHTCWLTSRGRVECAGDNFYGQLGTGNYASSLVPVEVVALADVTAISAGFTHACATVKDGVRCWGSNLSGQLGTGGNEFAVTTPAAVAGLDGPIAVAAGGMHTCALSTQGGVKCWGENGHGQLGIGSSDGSLTPADVIGLGSGVAAITAGARHTCALMTAGAVMCWGENIGGQLGNGGTSDSLVPMDVAGIAGGMTAVAAGVRHTCALSDTGEVKCWGANDGGQLGNGAASENPSPLPANVADLHDVAAIAAGRAHTCALTHAGVLKCWGANSVGELGDGTIIRRVRPSDILAGQSISFPVPVSLPIHVSFELGATATSGRGVVFDTWTPGTCSIEDGVLRTTSGGLCGVRASQRGGVRPAGGSDAAAPQIMRMLRVGGDPLFRFGFEWPMY